MLVSDVLACSMPAWYKAFAKTSIRTRFVPLPGDVVEYLRSPDTLVLPIECDQDEVDNSKEWSDDEDEGAAPSEEEAAQPSFPDFCAAVREAVSDLGGSVFCKLNWSSPKDATWMAFGNTLKCSSLTQILLLLKSSDFVSHDLRLPFQDCSNATADDDAHVSYVLVLRKWRDINPGWEFRCFVKAKKLIAISQRDNTHFYNHIREEEESIKMDILSFFQESVVEKFPLENYVFDVVRFRKDLVRLLDFGPFGVTTDSLLFEWESLLAEENSDDQVRFHYVEDDAGIQPSGLRQYSVPRDMVDLATGADPDKLIDFIKLQQRTQEDS